MSRLRCSWSHPSSTKSPAHELDSRRRRKQSTSASRQSRAMARRSVQSSHEPCDHRCGAEDRDGSDCVRSGSESKPAVCSEPGHGVSLSEHGMKKNDWKGRRVRLLRTIHTKSRQTFREGTEWTVLEQWHDRLTLGHAPSSVMMRHIPQTCVEWVGRTEQPE